MTLHVPIADLEPLERARLLAVLDNLAYWIRHDPHTREEYDASMAALADFDAARHQLRQMRGGVS